MVEAEIQFLKIPSSTPPCFLLKNNSNIKGIFDWHFLPMNDIASIVQTHIILTQ